MSYSVARGTCPLLTQIAAISGETMLLFLDRVLQWLQGSMTYGRVVNLFTMFDSDGDNLLSAEDFTVAMRMMEVDYNKSLLVPNHSTTTITNYR